MHVLNEMGGLLLHAAKVPSPPVCWAYRPLTSVPTLTGVSSTNAPGAPTRRVQWSTDIGTAPDATPTFSRRSRHTNPDSDPMARIARVRSDPIDGSLVGMSPAELRSIVP